ncbi:MAG: hypothetical protein KAH72_09245, partial [Flavobacteriaceae bacterium]|nr:hypothetical protein [Flavobacteriaceae bacterium]
TKVKNSLEETSFLAILVVSKSILHKLMFSIHLSSNILEKSFVISFIGETIVFAISTIKSVSNSKLT